MKMNVRTVLYPFEPYVLVEKIPTYLILKRGKQILRKRIKKVHFFQTSGIFWAQDNVTWKKVASQNYCMHVNHKYRLDGQYYTRFGVLRSLFIYKMVDNTRNSCPEISIPHSWEFHGVFDHFIRGPKTCILIQTWPFRRYAVEETEPCGQDQKGSTQCKFSRS